MDNKSCNPFHRSSSIKCFHTITQAIPWKNPLHELPNRSHRIVSFNVPVQQIRQTLIQRFILWKVSKYGVLSGPYFSAFGLIRRDSISLYSVRMRENTGQKKLRIWTHAVYGLKLQVKYRFYGQKIDCPLTD